MAITSRPITGPPLKSVFAIPFPVINPVALELGPLSIKWYGLAYVGGLLGGRWYSRRLVAAESRWGGLPRPKARGLDDMLLFAALGVVLGGQLGYA
jgi:phosphatidylglycerol:prolipoprotein diacylglycerol transferase